MTIYEFNAESTASDWKIVDDVVMGGVSHSTFEINEKQEGVFAGHVSLANNGGFCKLRHHFSPIDISSFTKVRIRLKGDGKDYQFRIKENKQDRHAYASSFETTGDWQTVEVFLKDMVPKYRGRVLNLQPLGANPIEEVSILIANKREESFLLVVNKIEIS